MTTIAFAIPEMGEVFVILAMILSGLALPISLLVGLYLNNYDKKPHAKKWHSLVRKLLVGSFLLRHSLSTSTLFLERNGDISTQLQPLLHLGLMSIIGLGFICWGLYTFSINKESSKDDKSSDSHQ